MTFALKKYRLEWAELLSPATVSVIQRLLRKGRLEEIWYLTGFQSLMGILFIIC